MAEIVMNLDKLNIESAVAALKFFDLFDLEMDASYPFLDERNWKDYGWGQKVFSFKNNTVVTPLETFMVFMIVNERHEMQSEKGGATVATVLRRVLMCLKEYHQPLGILPTYARELVYMGGPYEAAIDTLVHWKAAAHVILFLLQSAQTMKVYEALDRGHHIYLKPPD